MTFATGYLADPIDVGDGEIRGQYPDILGATTFEDGLKAGRFAKLDSGSIDNFDGSAAPVVAGVILRDVANKIEGADEFDTDFYKNISYIRRGFVNVAVKDGESPEKFGRVYISNAGDDDDGKAIASADGVDGESFFVEEVKSGVWMIFVDLSAKEGGAIADPGDGEAIPVVNSGSIGLTTADAETRTLADPSFVGQRLTISLAVDGGDAVITAASAVNQTGNNTLTMADAGDFIKLEAVLVAAAPKWRVVANDGVALSTV